MTWYHGIISVCMSLLQQVKRIYGIYSLNTPPHCDVSKGSQCFHCDSLDQNQVRQYLEVNPNGSLCFSSNPCKLLWSQGQSFLVLCTSCCCLSSHFFSSCSLLIASAGFFVQATVLHSRCPSFCWYASHTDMGNLNKGRKHDNNQKMDESKDAYASCNTHAPCR